MSGAPQWVSWGLKSFIFGSAIVTGVHYFPVIQQATMENAVKLASDEHKLFALEGLRRIRRQVRQSDYRRQGLLKYGALSVAVDAIEHHDDAKIREVAMETLSVFAHGAVRDANTKEGREGENARNAARQILRYPQVAKALVEDPCEKGCMALWNVVFDKRERPDSLTGRVEVMRAHGRTGRASDNVTDAGFIGKSGDGGVFTDGRDLEREREPRGESVRAVANVASSSP